VGTPCTSPPRCTRARCERGAAWAHLVRHLRAVHALGAREGPRGHTLYVTSALYTRSVRRPSTQFSTSFASVRTVGSTDGLEVQMKSLQYCSASPIITSRYTRTPSNGPSFICDGAPATCCVAVTRMRNSVRVLPQGVGEV
jgi:hypothetical protein